MLKKCLYFIFLILFTLQSTLWAKDTFNDKSGGSGHAGDISKLLLGLDYYALDDNKKTIITGLAYALCLTVDSTMNMDTEIPHYQAKNAMDYLQEKQAILKWNTIPNFRTFLTPGGSSHGYYTHLGWDHIYADNEYSYFCNTRWKTRKEIFLDVLSKAFNFSLFSGGKKDSLGALFYYVHILGDHEDDSITNAHTRIPIYDFNEQAWDAGWAGWNEDEQWRPETTIVDELNKHLPIIFHDQITGPVFNNLINEINRLPWGGQKEKAKYLLDSLHFYIPFLLQEEPFARSFYRKYKGAI
jgi:hypothetical protein